MTKLLKTIRFDESDTNVFARAAEQNEWAVSCAFQFCDLQWDELEGKPKQAFNNGFLGLSSIGYSTFCSVARISPTELDQAQLHLARYLVEDFGAPSLAAAMEAAKEEISYVSQLCTEVDEGKVFAVQRKFNADGRINESFHMVDVDADADEQCVHENAWVMVKDE